MLNSLVLGLLLSTPPAHASCASYLRRADTAKGAGIAKAFRDLAKCDKSVAEANFARFLANANDVDSLLALTMSAIESEVWNPAWLMLGKISSYEARDEIADLVGATCTENPKTIKFLQGAYFGLSTNSHS